jgi:hypothetical protein
VVAKLYDNDPFGGTSLIMTSDNSDLRTVGFSDRTSSVAIHGEIFEPSGSAYPLGSIVDLEGLKFKAASDPTVIKNLASFADMLGFAWCGGTRANSAGEDFDVSRNSDGTYAVNAHYGSSDPFADGYMADQRLKMTISNFRIAIDPATFVYGAPTITSLTPISLDTALARNLSDTESTIGVSLSTSHTDTYSHETNVSFTEGVKIAIKNAAEVPFFGSSEVTTEFSFSSTQGWKDTNTTADVVGTTLTYQARVPAQSQKLITLVGSRTRSNISYTAVANVTFDVSFYGFLRYTGNANINHPTDRPFITQSFNSGGLSGLEAIVDLYDHSFIGGGDWDWDWIKAFAGGSLGSTMAFFRHGISVPLDGKFTGVIGTNVTFTEGAVQPL